MNNNVMKFGYEDTDKKIEVNLYGLIFEINNLDNIEKIENLDINNSSIVEVQLEEILGKGSIEKINNKRVSDGYKKLDLNIETNILGCIFEAYANSMNRNVLGRVKNTVNNINKDINSFGNINREQRRNNRNNYRRNRYRRY